MFKPGTQMTVLTGKRTPKARIWTKAGVAVQNADGSINLYLDVLPLEGVLKIVPPKEG